MAQTTFKQKILLLLCAVIASLLLVEIGLRVAGFIHLSIRDQKNKTALTNRDSYRILCLGESTTYLGGDNNYPKYLNEILNTSNIKKSFTVINKGTPGVSTDFILNNITSWINEYHPDIVLVMMGINDDMLIARDQKPDSTILSFFKNTRVYKLTLWLGSSLKNRRSKKSSEYLIIESDLTEETTKTASLPTIRDQFFQRLDRADHDYQELYGIAVLLEGSKQYEFSEHIYLDLISKTNDPLLHKWLYKKLGEALRQQGKYSDFVDLMPYISYDYWGYEWLEHVCTNDAGIEHVEAVFQSLIKRTKNNAPFYELLSQCYAQSGKTGQAEEYRQKAKEAMLKTIHPATQRNYLKLAQILNQNNISAVYVQYPLRSVESLKKILKPSPNSDRIIFVDNEAVFKQALEHASYKDYFIDIFAGEFGHCTEKGNRLLAQNIASVLSQHITSNTIK